MKKIIVVIAVLFISISAFSQTKIAVDDVAKHIGDSGTVCSKVYGVKKTEKITFINIGDAYPNSPLTVVLFAKDYANFPEDISKMYNNKSVCITGIISEFKGKVQIVISKPADLVVE